jgi:uncharacterized protein with PIN domain
MIDCPDCEEELEFCHKRLQAADYNTHLWQYDYYYCKNCKKYYFVTTDVIK